MLRHLLDRIQQRQVSPKALGLLAEWLDTRPEVPAGPWFKRFPCVTVRCGGELIKTFLQPGQLPYGGELH